MPWLGGVCFFVFKVVMMLLVSVSDGDVTPPFLHPQASAPPPKKVRISSVYLNICGLTEV